MSKGTCCRLLLLFIAVCALTIIYTQKSALIGISNYVFSLNENNPDNSTNINHFYFSSKYAKVNDTYSNISNTTINDTYSNVSNTTINDTYSNVSNTTINDTYSNVSNTTINDTYSNVSNTTINYSYYSNVSNIKMNNSYSTSNYKKNNDSYSVLNYKKNNDTKINNVSNLTNLYEIKYGSNYFSLQTKYDDNDIDNILNIAIITANIYDNKTQLWDGKTAQLNQIKDIIRSRNIQYVLNKNKLFRSNNESIYYDYYEFLEMFLLNNTNNTEFTNYQHGMSFMDILNKLHDGNQDQIIQNQKMFYIKYVLEQPNKYKYILWKDWDSIFIDCSINLQDIINNNKCTSQDLIIQKGYNNGVFLMKNTAFINDIFIGKYYVKVMENPVIHRGLVHDNLIFVAIWNGFFQTFNDKDFELMENANKFQRWFKSHDYHSQPHEEFKSRICFTPNRILQTFPGDVMNNLDNIHDFIIHFPGTMASAARKLYPECVIKNAQSLGCITRHLIKKWTKQYACHA